MANENDNYTPTEESYSYQAPEEPKEPESEKRSFWEKNGATIITVVVLGLIIGGAIAVNENRTNEVALDTSGDQTIILDEDEITSDENGIIDQGQDNTDQNQNTDQSTEQPSNNQQTTFGLDEEILVDNGQYIVTTLPGNGRTHLARRAITRSLIDSDTNLSPEQRVYAEDYLQEKYEHISPLHPGDVVDFSSGDVSEAIGAAQSLTDAQLQNLTQYSNLVNWPPI